MSKNLRPLLFFIPLFTIFIIFLLFLSRGSLSLALFYFSKSFIYFNILFCTLYFYMNREPNILSILLVAIFSLFITVLLCEVIYPQILKQNTILPLIIIKNNNNNNEINKLVYKDRTIPLDNLGKAEYYLDLEEFSSAWIYADKVLDSENSNSVALELKFQAQKGLSQLGFVEDNPKYIETIKYKSLINQNRFLDAYYFCLDKINNKVYDHDFLIKIKSCYKILLEEYYSIDFILSILNRPGYSDIKFYSTSGDLKLYEIEKLVEFDNEYFLQNIKINNEFYPYIFIDKKGKIFSSGFKEDYNFLYKYNNPIIPIKSENLKLFSKEFYNVSTSSLLFNTKIFAMENIKYFKESILSNLIITKLTGYLTILILFFMGFNYMKDIDYLNYTFAYLIVLFTFKWFIKKIGLILIFYGLGLSFLIVILLYSIWLFILIRKFNQLHALS